MSRTLLYTVQRVLEKLDLDPVNSINDSPDAILIAREAEDTFYDLLSRNEWPERYDIINVESVSDTNNPTALRLPDNVTRIQSVRYDVTATGDVDQCYKELQYLSEEDFLDKVYSRNTSDDDVVVSNYKGIDIYVYDNCAPQYYTTFDNEMLILDAYDSDVETVVQGAKTVVRASSVPTFVSDDTYVVPLDNNTYPLYLAELTSSCSYALNGAADAENERRRNRGISRLRKSSFRTGEPDLKNYFGRNGNGRS